MKKFMPEVSILEKRDVPSDVTFPIIVPPMPYVGPTMPITQITVTVDPPPVYYQPFQSTPDGVDPGPLAPVVEPTTAW